MERVKKLSDLSTEFIGKKVQLSGWVKGTRVQGEGGTLVFVDLNDGTIVLDPVRLVAHKKTETETEISYEPTRPGALTWDQVCEPKHLNNGCSAYVWGCVVKPPEGTTQTFEIKVTDVVVIDAVQDLVKYPLQKSNAKNLQALRQLPFRRFGNPLIVALMKVRSEALFAVHEFMHKEDVTLTDPNIMTSSDCEGAGEMFVVTPQFFGPDGKESESKVGLTVSSQLPLEAFAMGSNSVYTAQKSFRAEKSDTNKHLAEFLHIEYEKYFITLDDLLTFTERFVKYVIKTTLDRCKDCYALFNDKKKSPKELMGHDSVLRSLLEKDFVRITHKDAIDLMKKDLRYKAKHIGPSGKLVKLKFKKKPEHGEDLGSEHEKYLVEKFGTFVFVTHWPSQIKSFYMSQLDDGTCEAFDLLAPICGELFGGSMREWRMDVLQRVIKERGMDASPIQWFVDLRKDGSAPHGGWGMGFDRLVMFLTNVPSVRDVVPLPVYYGHCPY
jgi:asparaginyl-tRNA synthetase